MLNSLYFGFFFVTVYNFLITSDAQLLCRDEENQPVDWFVMYKIPKISESSNPLVKQGVAYAYMTSSSVDGWKLSEKSIRSENSIPGNTLAPLYRKNDSVLWTLYNDRPPNQDSVPNYGHTKGVVMADIQQGFWLVHSVPNYPPSPDHGTIPPRARSERAVESKLISTQRYNYPTTGEPYGQSFICISVDKNQFDVIGTQLMYNQIISYKINLPETIKLQYPNLTKAANKIRIKHAPFNHKSSITSLEGTEFLMFAKSDKWGKDLYDDFVGPQLGSDLLTETWPNGPGRLPSDCSGSKVINIKSINLAVADVVFKTTRDHSKWVVCDKGKTTSSWVCIGDINRASSQLERGGGTVCLNSHRVWQSYRNIVNDVDACPKIWNRFVKWISRVF